MDYKPRESFDYEAWERGEIEGSGESIPGIDPRTLGGTSKGCSIYSQTDTTHVLCSWNVESRSLSEAIREQEEDKSDDPNYIKKAIEYIVCDFHQEILSTILSSGKNGTQQQ